MEPALRIAIFLGTTGLVVMLLALHVERRATRFLRLSRRVSRALITLLVLGVLSAVAARLLPAGALSRSLGMFGAMITLGIIISSVLLWPFELARLLAGIVKAVRRLAASKAPEAPAQPERREFLAQATVGSALAVGFGASSYGALFGRHDYSLDTVTIKLDKLPRALEGFTIVQLSDIHVGQFVR